MMHVKFHVCACVQFVLFASTVCQQLASRGYWADYLDPCSGLTVCIHPDKAIAMLDKCNVAASSVWGAILTTAKLLSSKFCVWACSVCSSKAFPKYADGEQEQWVCLLRGGCFLHTSAVQDSKCRLLQGKNLLPPHFPDLRCRINRAVDP